MNTLQLWTGRALYRLGRPLINSIFRHGAVRTRVFIVVNGELLLVKNWIGTGNWSLPGGGLHPREDPATGAVRELNEELGLSISAADLHLLTSTPVTIAQGTASFKCMAFLLTLSSKPTLKPRKSEISDTDWKKLDQIKQAILGDSLTQLLPILEAHKNLLK